MEEVIVISYLFNIVGQHREIHTEVRAFGFDWWFEKDGAKAQPASSKENDPEWGYTLQQKISAGYTSKSHNEFERYLSSIANDYRAQDYQLFSRNCREYSQKLLNFLDPDNAREAKIFLQGQNLDAKIKGDLVNIVGGCVSSYAANYFMGGQQRAQSSTNQNSCWDDSQWDTTWSTPGNSAGSNTDSSNGSYDANRNSQSGNSQSSNSQSRSATRPTIVDSLFEVTGTEKPKDTAGWIELGVKSFASWNRNKGNGNK